MSTRLQRSKTGLKLECNVSRRPVPRPRQVFPIPELIYPFLTLELDNTGGRAGIKCTIDATLPEGGRGTWNLLYRIQGSDAINLVTVTAGSTWAVSYALPGLTYAFRLQRIDASGTPTTYPEATITTPSSYALGSAADVAVALKKIADAESDDWLTDIEKPMYRGFWATAQAEYVDLVNTAVDIGVDSSSFETAYEALSAVASCWTGTGSVDISEISPPILTRWATYFSERTKLQDAVGVGASVAYETPVRYAIQANTSVPGGWLADMVNNGTYTTFANLKTITGVDPVVGDRYFMCNHFAAGGFTPWSGTSICAVEQSGSGWRLQPVGDSPTNKSFPSGSTVLMSNGSTITISRRPGPEGVPWHRWSISESLGTPTADDHILYAKKDNTRYWGAPPSVETVTWSSVTDKPTSFTPSAHTHGLGRESLAPANSRVDSLTTANFRTVLFGNATAGFQLAPARWDNAPALLSGMSMYGTLLAWGGSDTHGFLALNYNNPGAMIGGGNTDGINWTAFLWHTGNFDPATKAAASHTHGNADLAGLASATVAKANVLGGAGAYTGDDTNTFAQRNAKGVHFGRTQGASDAPGGDASGYYNYLLLPEGVGAYSQSVLAMGNGNGRIFYGYGLWNAAPTWRELIHSGNIGSQSVDTSVYSVIRDTRASGWAPNAYYGQRAHYEFTNQHGISGFGWASIFTMKGWGDNNYASWQMAGNSHNANYEKWFLRQGIGTSWTPWREIVHSGNLASYLQTYGDNNVLELRAYSTIDGAFKPGHGIVQYVAPGPITVKDPVLVFGGVGDASVLQMQFVTPSATPGKVRYRKGDGAGSWSGWNEFYSTENFNPSAYAGDIGAQGGLIKLVARGSGTALRLRDVSNGLNYELYSDGGNLKLIQV